MMTGLSAIVTVVIPQQQQETTKNVYVTTKSNKSKATSKKINK